MSDQETFNKLADGMEQVNREMAAKIEKDAPYCHCKKMFMDHLDGDYGTESWWECSVCGHTKTI